MPSSESAAHLHLKRLALVWAQAQGYAIVGCEVSLPNLRCRLDVGAYRPGARRAVLQAHARRPTWVPTVGTTAIFECKASRADLLRDCRQTSRLLERMKALTEKRTTLERLLKIHFPSLRQGDGLWPEYDTICYDELTHAPYLKVLKDLQTTSRQLHGQTKMETLHKWQAANLHYLVVEPALAEPHEIPAGWGLLIRRADDRLELARLPEWGEVDEGTRLSFLHRVAAAGSRATNREAGVDYLSIELERRGLSGQTATKGSGAPSSDLVP